MSYEVIFRQVILIAPSKHRILVKVTCSTTGRAFGTKDSTFLRFLHTIMFLLLVF